MNEDLKLWWVFAGEQYYPSSALGDLKGTFHTEPEADTFAATLTRDWVKVEFVGRYVGIEQKERWMTSSC